MKICTYGFCEVNKWATSTAEVLNWLMVKVAKENGLEEELREFIEQNYADVFYVVD